MRILDAGTDTIHPKLRIGATGDRFEREADAAVRAMENGSRPNVTRTNGRGVQKRVDTSTAETDGATVPSNFGDGLSRSIASRGEALPEGIRHSVETRLGIQLPDVRIHKDRRATQLSESVGALAFAYGSDVFFARGEYRPDNANGRRLLHHELIHTLQQGGKAGIIQRAPKNGSTDLRGHFDRIAKEFLNDTILFFRRSLIEIRRFLPNQEGVFVGMATPFMNDARSIVNRSTKVMTFDVERLVKQFLAIVSYLLSLIPAMKEYDPEHGADIESVDKELRFAARRANKLLRQSDALYSELTGLAEARRATNSLAIGVTATDLAKIEVNAREAALSAPSEEFAAGYTEVVGRAGRRLVERRTKPARGGETVTDESDRIEKRGGSGTKFSVAEQARRSAARLVAPRGGKRDYVVIENVTAHVQFEGIDESGEFARAFHSALEAEAMQTYRAMAADRSGRGILLFLINATNNDLALASSTAADNNVISKLASTALNEGTAASGEAQVEPVLTLDFGNRNIALEVNVIAGKVRISAPRGDDAKHLGVPGIYAGIDLEPNDPVMVIRQQIERIQPAILLGAVASKSRTDTLIEGATLAWVPGTIDSALDAVVELAREAKKVANVEIRDLVHRLVSDPLLAERIVDYFQLIVDELVNGLVGLSGLVGGLTKGMYSALLGLVAFIRGISDWVAALIRGLWTLDGKELEEKSAQLWGRLTGIPSALSEYFRRWRDRYADADDTEQARMIGELTGEVLAILGTSGRSAAKVVRGAGKLPGLATKAGETVKKAVEEAASHPGMRPAYAGVAPAGPPPSIRVFEGTASFSKKIAPKPGGKQGTAGRRSAPKTTAGKSASNTEPVQGVSSSPEVGDIGRLGASAESVSAKSNAAAETTATPLASASKRKTGSSKHTPMATPGTQPASRLVPESGPTFQKTKKRRRPKKASKEHAGSEFIEHSGAAGERIEIEVERQLNAKTIKNLPVVEGTYIGKRGEKVVYQLKTITSSDPVRAMRGYIGSWRKSLRSPWELKKARRSANGLHKGELHFEIPENWHDPDLTKELRFKVLNKRPANWASTEASLRKLFDEKIPIENKRIVFEFVETASADEIMGR